MERYLPMLVSLFLWTALLPARSLTTLSTPHPPTIHGNMDCRQQDSLVLVELYNATNGANWTNTWDLNQPMNTWYGVALNAEGCVEVLDMDGYLDAGCPGCSGGGNNLTDTIPFSIWDLTELKKLSLSWNQPTVLDSLPHDIDKLSEIEELNLLQLGIEGEIPTSIGSLANLEYLHLGFNNLTGVVPNTLQNLTNLTHLYIYNNQFTTLPDLGNLTQLRVLSVGGNPLGGTLPQWLLDNLSNIEVIQWDDCQLNGTIPDNIWSGKDNLYLLNLANNNLTGTIPSGVGNLPNLRFLFLYNNQLTGTIPTELVNINSMIRIDLSDNQLNELIPDFAAANSPLRDLLVQNNELTFEDLLPNFEVNQTLIRNNTNNSEFEKYHYQPQAMVGTPNSFNFLAGQDYTFDLIIDDTVTTNTYKWYKNGVLYQTKTGDNTLALTNVTTSDIGTYTCEITNPNIPDLTLESHPYRLSVIDPDCRMKDSLILVDLYNATNGANWTNTWDLNQPMTTWYGVTLGVNGCVAVVDLDGYLDADCENCSSNGNALVGSLPTNFWNLKNLTKLSFGSNFQLNAAFTSAIGNLSQLRFLNLYNVNFSATNIPPEIGNLPQLTTLLLGGNQLTGALPAELGNLTQLKELVISANQLSGTIPNSLNQLTKLESLNLSSNQFSNLPDDLSDLKKLRYLDLSFNPFNTNLPTWIGELSAITDLNLVGNDWTGTIPPSIGDLAELFFLSLRSNQLTGTVPNNFSNLQKLALLYLYDNQLEGVFPSAVANLPVLEHVLIYDNNFSGTIPDFTISNTRIRNLQLHDNQFTFKDILPNLAANETAILNNNGGNTMYDSLRYDPQQKIATPTTIEFTTGDNQLLSLNIDNFITSNVYKWYKDDVEFQTVNGNSNLSFTNLSESDAGVYTCQVTNPNAPDLTLESHPFTLSFVDPSCRMRDSLILVDLYNATGGASWTTTWDLNQPMDTWFGVTLNEFGCVRVLDLDGIHDVNCSGCIGGGNNVIGEIPTNFWNLSELRHLSLNNNQLTTPSFPTALFDLTKLENLGLVNVSLNGALPAAIGNLVNLTSLSLGNCQLTGTIPDELGTLANLTFLALPDNQLNGTIPHSLNGLTKLNILNLLNNQFTGVANLSSLQLLQTLSLSNNPLGGSIPEWIGNLSNLSGLSLYNTQLIGTIPDFFTGLTNLNLLHLGDNQLTGNIPNSLATSNIGVLYLWNNQLSGIFPADLVNASLQQVAIQGNNFEGLIPDFSTTATNFGNLEIQNNQFTFEDIIPHFAANKNIIATNGGGDSYTYQPQAKVGAITSINVAEGTDYTFDLGIDDTVTTNTYTWFKNGQLYQTIQGNNELTIPNAGVDDLGTYTCEITNSIATDLTLESHPYTLSIFDPECRMKDSLVLVELYNATGGANWNNTWDLNQPMTTWFGVELNVNGCVSVLDLDGHLGNCLACFSENNIIGTLPETIWNLKNLIHLSFNGNSGLNATLPSQIDNLLELKYLYLRSISLSGSIPTEIGNLSALEQFVADGNQLTGAIPSTLNNLLNLEVLNLSYNQLTGLPNLGSLTKLINLNLSGNNFGGNIPSWVADLNQLQILILFSNNWSGTIPSAIGNLTNLVNLNLDNNQLQGNIPNSFSNLSILHTLSLRNNQLSGTLPAFLAELPVLGRLDLYNNNFTGLIPDLGTDQMIDLNVGENALTFEDIIPNIGSIEAAILNNTSNPARDSFRYDPQPKIGMETTISFIAGNDYNIDLDIDDTVTTNVYTWYKDGNLHQIINGTPILPINNASADDIGVYTCQVTNLNAPDLTLESYPYTLRIVDTECRMQDSLVLVDLYNATNGANWTNTWDLNQPMSTWYGVTTNIDGCMIGLDLDGNANDNNCLPCNYGGNNLVGTLPNNLWNLDNLIELSLGNNRNLVGTTIPNSINNLTALTKLNLGEINLSGAIPSEIGNLLNLTRLNLRGNQLSGTIPASLNNLTKLIELNLSFNQLSSLPDLGDLIGLIQLTVSDNPFNTSIPGWLGNLIELDNLQLSNNGWTGNIPSFLGNLIKLNSLNIGYNRFTGEIPTSFSNLNPHFLFLAGNQLSGDIATSFAHMDNLISLNLYGNQFTGIIPDFATIAPDMQSLDVGLNRLTFKDILPNITTINAALQPYNNQLSYRPQAQIGTSTSFLFNAGDSYTFDLGIDEAITGNVYRWYKNGILVQTITGNNKLTLTNVTEADLGIYTCQVTNSGASNLTLFSVNYNLVGSIPANDNICEAQVLTIGTTVEGTFTGASSQINEPTVAGNNCQTSWCNADLNGSVWYAFTAPANPYVNIKVIGTNFSDTKIALYEDINCGSSNPFENAALIAASDEIPDQCCNGSLINLACLNAGSLYFIQVEQSNASQGNFFITVNQMAGCELPCDLSFVNPPSVTPMSCPGASDAVANHFVQSPAGHRLTFDLYDDNNNLLRTQSYSNFFGLSVGNYTFVARSLDEEGCMLSNSFEVVDGIDNIPPFANCINEMINVAFVREESIHPFGDNSTFTEEMNAVFSSNWHDLTYESVNPQLLFSDAYNFVYLEGSGDTFNEFQTFFNANKQLIEDWTALGNTLFLNAAPWTNSTVLNLGFDGVQLDTRTNSLMATATDASHPIFVGPHTPVATSYTGNAGFSIICPPTMNATTLLKNEDDKDLLVEAAWGTGTVFFGGLAASRFTNNLETAMNLRSNIFDYLENKAILAANTPKELALDVNQTATLTPALLNVGSFDDCALMSLQVNKTTFDCFDVGLQPITMMATDASGNSSTCTTTIMVTAPNDYCADLIGECLNERTMNSTMDDGIYPSATTFTATGAIANNKRVVFKAGTSITLYPGFHAQAGSDFTAMIEDCTPDNPLQDEVAAERSQTALTEVVRRPAELALKVAPNPFNGQTTVDYYLPTASPTKIQLMDFMGREIQVLRPLQQQSAGWHQLTIHAENLPTGTYFLVLQNKGELKTRQLILVR